MTILQREALRRRALLLVWIGELWNVLEAVVALWAAYSAGSVALFAFGIKSLVELFAGGVLIWRLGREWAEEEEEAAERIALRLVGVTFFLLAAYILGQSLVTLTGLFAEPEESVVGIALVLSSALVMALLYRGKMGIARVLVSPALRAEAIESLMCDLADMTVFVGLGLNALWGWWWADPASALLLIPYLLKEGWEAWRGEHDE